MAARIRGGAGHPGPELRGDLASATHILKTALGQATEASDKAYIDYYLGELAFNSGHPVASLRYNQQGLDADPSYWQAGQKLYRGGDRARSRLV